MKFDCLLHFGTKTINLKLTQVIQKGNLNAEIFFFNVVLLIGCLNFQKIK